MLSTLTRLMMFVIPVACIVIWISRQEVTCNIPIRLIMLWLFNHLPSTPLTI